MISKRIWLLIIIALVIAGCSGTLQSTWNGLRRGGAPSAEDFRQRAAVYETQGSLRQALLSYRAAALLAPHDPAISGSIKSLEREIANAVDDHFRQGVAHFDSGDVTRARREFLIVLRLAPDHRNAKNYLKVKIPLADRKLYKVQRGDSFAKIALEVYNDPSKAYTIAYFNGLDPEKPLWIGTELLLPRLSAGQILPRKEITLLLEKARAALEQKHYETVLEITEKIKAQDPANAEVTPLDDASRFALGMIHLGKKDYFPALDQFKRISDGFKGRDAAIRKARRSLQQQNAEERIRAAGVLYKKGDYRSAINITEEILVQAPSNQKAKTLLYESHYALGKQLLEQGKEEQAIESLRVLDKGFQDTAQLMSLAHARVNASAEEYYRQGVKQFLNEELENAIGSWRKALALNPNHPKAQQDIDNALRLLEKWRGLDQGDKIGP